MKIVTYNIHYAIGKDNQYDLERVIDSVRDADIIALQEVERNYGPPDGPSQPEDIALLLPDYYWVFDAAFDIDGSIRNSDGSITNRRRQHGQMLLSRWPIHYKRYYPLPRIRIDTQFNMQMGVLESVIETPLGWLRVNNVHFGSVASVERQRQARFAIKMVRDAPAEGGAWTGPAGEHAERDWSAGQPPPPMPASVVMLGDFNMLPDSPEYASIATASATATAFDEESDPLLTDIHEKFNPGENIQTWHPNSGRSGDEESARLDYCFLTSELVTGARASWVDEAADGSDHQPLWIELE